MKRSRSAKILGYLLAATYLLALPASQAMVLCVGEDDHKAVEFAHGDCGADSHSTEHVSGSIADLHETSETSHCHNCDDISIGILLVSNKSQSDDRVPAPPDATFFDNSAFFTRSLPTSANVYLPHRKPPSSFPSFLSTIILLI